jgi:hypothetical protein
VGNSVDLGAYNTGQLGPANGCFTITQFPDTWPWGDALKLGTMEDADPSAPTEEIYPINFDWEQACSGLGGTNLTLSWTWVDANLGVQVTPDCPVFFRLKGNGAHTVRLRWL